jgi:hypothetical protein
LLKQAVHVDAEVEQVRQGDVHATQTEATAVNPAGQVYRQDFSYRLKPVMQDKQLDLDSHIMHGSTHGVH